MSESDLPRQALDVLARPNPAVIATVNAEGDPVTVATWYLWENGQVLVNMDGGRARLKHLRRDPRVSLTVLNDDDWYQHVSLRGKVVRMADDPDLADIDRLARHYLGKPYPDRDRPRVSAWIQVSSWHGWNMGER
ncbi:PPOX class F420-dependent oxidoreductase [Saccharopolyspora erythraea]|uniref:PPOX class F420-dependent oxidoreductase n=1 Tax=Saccharopolyspora erythraea TaxID=1836 RepID=UPI001BAA4320|nr:PPOX class F420-dependent oxidoreductase [Saccharopolyspora erythraea]QUH00568.1 PPOX class F420-dependent oxidoreductase [Saccharopolyspora erythraea]